MALNDTYEQEATGVASGGDFLVEGSAAATGAAEVFELGGGAAADVYREIDVDGDGTYEVSILIESLTGSWHSQKNQLVVSAGKNTRIRVNNTSGGAADYYAVGMEVDD